MAQNNQLCQNLYDSYSRFIEKSLDSRRIKHSEILPLIDNLKKKRCFSVEKIAASSEGRDIFLIKIGKGEKKIFLWAQMHGDESTADRCLFDIFNFFKDTTSFKNEKKFILDNTTLYFIPMLNPDGAERFIRYSSAGVDINRDAIGLITPEAQVLFETFKKISPNYCFNLHDQSTGYNVGSTYRSAAISLLAPAIDEINSDNQNRVEAKKLCAYLYSKLGDFIPGHIAKYKTTLNDYEPKAFGDTFQKLGAATILIESGGWFNDLEKDFLRKINFVALLSAFHAIAQNAYSGNSVEQYESIPNNNRNLHALILRNININIAGKDIISDIAIDRPEMTIQNTKEFYSFGKIVKLGYKLNDFGIEEYDLSDYTVREAKVFETESLADAEPINYDDLLKQGFGFIKLKSPAFLKGVKSLLPFNTIKNDSEYKPESIKTGSSANFFIYRNNKPEYAIINGCFYDLSKSTDLKSNGLQY